MDEDNEELSEGEDIPQMTQEQRFAYDKQMFAAQLKQELMFGKRKVQPRETFEQEYEDEEEDGSYGEEQVISHSNSGSGSF